MEAEDDTGKPPRGGKRSYTMSPRALAQRRTAAYKTGEHAGTALAQAVPPCKPSHCPMSDPDKRGNCEVRQELDAQGRTPSRCVVSLAVDDEIRAKYLAAIQKGDTNGIAELSATMLAAHHVLTADQLAKLQAEGGYSIEVDVYDKDGKWIGKRAIENPRAELTLKSMEMLGHTAIQQAITPKTGAERDRDKGIAGTLDAMRRRNELAAASGRNG